MLCAIIFVMASADAPSKQRKKSLKVLRDSMEMSDIADSIARDTLLKKVDSTQVFGVDTTKMDSLQLAIYHHNKAIDDSIRLDSINRQRAGGINSPVNYSANDSLVYDATTKTARLFGSSTVKYENMDLAAERIHMSLDSSLVHATGAKDKADTTGVTLFGTPVFSMGPTSTRATPWRSTSRRRRDLSATYIHSRRTDSCAARFRSAVRTAKSSFSTDVILPATPKIPTSI